MGKLAKCLMIQGTASSVGKTTLVAALCRILVQDGIKVAPFKAQNMALNAAVTAQGHEIGRAQAMQAEACQIAPSVHMNPILLKPVAHTKSQVVLQGKAIGDMSFLDYHKLRPQLIQAIDEGLESLSQDFDVILIEGAGSPAEVNLQDRDIVNMFTARRANAPVLLAGAIDRGGVLASLIGTLALLSKEDQARVAGLLVNRFRGDMKLFDDGVIELEKRTNKPVLGVIPYIRDLNIADEDTLEVAKRQGLGFARKHEIEIAVINTPYLSNYDDVLPFEKESEVIVRFIDDPRDVLRSDLVIVGGSKSVISDFKWLIQNGFVQALQKRNQIHLPILGICGGCQMLGQIINDELQVENTPGVTQRALGLLDLTTKFQQTKITQQVQGKLLQNCFLGTKNTRLTGYYIHAGITTSDNPAIELEDGKFDGSFSQEHLVGTMVHGLFDDDNLRKQTLYNLRNANVHSTKNQPEAAQFDTYDYLAETVKSHINLSKLYEIIGL